MNLYVDCTVSNDKPIYIYYLDTMNLKVTYFKFFTNPVTNK